MSSNICSLVIGYLLILHIYKVRKDKGTVFYSYTRPVTFFVLTMCLSVRTRIVAFVKANAFPLLLIHSFTSLLAGSLFLTFAPSPEGLLIVGGICPKHRHH